MVAAPCGKGTRTVIEYPPWRQNHARQAVTSGYFCYRVRLRNNFHLGEL